MYPGLSHDEIIEECLKELKHHFEVGPEVALISAEKGVQCVPFDESLQKKFPYFEGTYEVFDVPHTDFQIRYQPEQILAASGRKILTGTAFLCRRENERCLMLPSRYEKVDVEDFIREHSERAYVDNTQPIFVTEDDEDSVDFKRYEKAITVTDVYHETKNRFAWVGEIKNEHLLAALEKLNAKDLELLTLFAYEGYTVTEISKVLHCSQPTISIKIKRITKFLKNFEFDAMD